MLPLSGALQLNTVGAIKLRPLNSAMCAYSCTDKPCPNSGQGKNIFHKPAALALAFNCSNCAGHCHLVQSPP